MDITSLYQIKPNPQVPKLSPGDTVKVTYKVKEAAKERLQVLPGLIIKIKRANSGGSFTIRRVASGGIGVEHTFPLASPLLDKVEVVRHGKVRRAKLYYIRRLSAKDARLKERRDQLEEAGVAPEMITSDKQEAQEIQEVAVADAQEAKTTEET